MNKRVRSKTVLSVIPFIVCVVIALAVCAFFGSRTSVRADETATVNALRGFYGTEDPTTDFDKLVYAESCDDLLLLRPEHGDIVYWSLDNNSEENRITRTFAVEFTGGTAEDYDATVVKYYSASRSDGGEYTLGDEQTDKVFGSYFEGLPSGQYFLAAHVPLFNASEDHYHWYEPADAQIPDEGATVPAFDKTYSVTVSPFDLAKDGGVRITVAMGDSSVNEYEYTGEQITPDDEITVTFDDVELVNGIDYQLTYANNINVSAGTPASVLINGVGNFSGTLSQTFTIIKSQNTWNKAPEIIQWEYGKFNRERNLIRAFAKFGGTSAVRFTVSRDYEGKDAIEGLEDFSAPAGVVSTEVAEILNCFEASLVYYLTASVPDSENYYGILPPPPGNDDDTLEVPYVIGFTVLRAENAWLRTPSIGNWTEGKYNPSADRVEYEALFGNDDVFEIVIADTTASENIIYNSESGINGLKEAKAGLYKLSVTLRPTTNYSGLTFTTTFRILEVETVGMPWWGTLLIVIGALLLVALVLFILWKKGVFEILTSKMVVAIHTRAMVDATIAAVRAIKMEESGKQSIALAEASDRKEERKRLRLEERKKSAEERAAELEEKARVAAKRAEKMQARADKMQARAEQMKAEAEKQRADRAEANAAQEQADTARAEAASAKVEALSAQAEADSAHAEAVAEARKTPVEVDYSPADGEEANATEQQTAEVPSDDEQTASVDGDDTAE